MVDQMADSGRYQRQELLPQLGSAGQRRLSNSKILLIGCGALGCTLADLLVRAGVGFLRLVDRDLVELNNLQRQTLFDERDAELELPKAVAAQKRLAQINSHVSVDTIVADVNAGDIASLAQLDGRNVDLILDGTDNVATRYLINDFAVGESIPWVYCACVGVEGRVMSIWPGKTACLRCLFPDPPAPASLPTCDTAGVLGSVAVAVAAFAAAAAIRLLTDGPSQSGLLNLNIWEGDLRRMNSAATPSADCPCCVGREFPFLSTKATDFTTTLCGRNAIQILQGNGHPMDLGLAAGRLREAGVIEQSAYFLRCRLKDPEGIDFTLFPDGRLLIKGTSDPLRAKSLYARYIGS